MDAETQVAADAQDAAEELPSDRIADLVELIVCGLVDDEDAVSLDVTDREDGTLIEIECAADDAGKQARSPDQGHSHDCPSPWAASGFLCRRRGAWLSRGSRI